jgi:hypothetical protein
MSDQGAGVRAGSGHLDDGELAAWALGALPADEAARAGDHLAGCAACRAAVDELTPVVGMLGEVPPEAFLDGPDPDADLLVQRTLRRLREEEDGGSTGPVPGGTADGSSVARLADRRARPVWPRAAAAAAAVVVLAGGGAVLGRATAPDAPLASAPPAAESAAPSPDAPRPVVLDATDADSGVRLLARLEPAPGWVRIAVSTTGVPQGERCQIVVATEEGAEVVAATWVVSETGEKEGSSLEGAAWFPAEEIVSVRVQNEAGRIFATASA